MKVRKTLFSPVSASKARKFIQLRAAGASLEKVQKTLKISLGTARKWAVKYQAQIAAQEQKLAENLAKQGRLEREHRLKICGEVIEKLLAKIGDLETADPVKLLPVLLDFLRFAKSELDPVENPVNPTQTQNQVQVIVSYDAPRQPQPIDLRADPAEPAPVTALAERDQ